jgi:hypothetical protein
MDSDFNLLIGLASSKFFQNFLVGGASFSWGDATFMIFDLGGQRR